MILVFIDFIRLFNKVLNFPAFWENEVLLNARCFNLFLLFLYKFVISWRDVTGLPIPGGHVFPWRLRIQLPDRLRGGWHLFYPHLRTWGLVGFSFATLLRQSSHSLRISSCWRMWLLRRRILQLWYSYLPLQVTRDQTFLHCCWILYDGRARKCTSFPVFHPSASAVDFPM